MDLEVRQDEAFSRREWVVERIGWVTVTTFVLAALVGLLGNGPLSWNRTDPGAAVVVEHDARVRYEADDSITLVIDPTVIDDGTASVQITGPWVGGIDLHGIWPEPASQQLVPGGVVLEFDVASPGELEVTVAFRAQEYGPLEAQVVAGDDVVTFSQFVFP